MNPVRQLVVQFIVILTRLLGRTKRKVHDRSRYRSNNVCENESLTGLEPGQGEDQVMARLRAGVLIGCHLHSPSSRRTWASRAAPTTGAAAR